MKNLCIGLMKASLLSVMLAGPVWGAGADHLRNHPQQNPATAYVEGSVLVKMKGNASASSIKGAFQDLASKASPLRRSKFEFKPFASLQRQGRQDLVVMKAPGVTTEKLIETFRKHPDVESAEPDYIITIDTVPDDASFDELWSLDNKGQEVDEETGTDDADIDAPEAWDHMTGNEANAKVVVAVIDTGVDYTHGDLAGNMWVNTAERNGKAGVDDDGNGYVDDIHGIDTANGDSDPYDDHSHGTHVAGTIAAVTNNGEGVAGITWNTAQVMALKFLGAGGSGATSDAITCIDYMVAMKKAGHNVVVMNASWGSTSPSDTLKAAIERAADAGVLMSAAAGNSTNDCDGNQKHYPSSYDVRNVLSVAATDQNDHLAYFSNYGASEVDIAAPGVNILSSVPGGGYVAYSYDPFYDSMEKGADLWDPALTVGEWGITDEKSFDSYHAWSDSPYKNYEYAPDEGEFEYSLVSKPIDLSDQVHADGSPKTLMLGFWLYKDLLPYVCPHGHKDMFYVEFSGDNGLNWTILGSHYGSDPNWKNYSYSIPASLLTDRARIRFRMNILHHGSADGVYIDRIGIGEANEMGAFKFFNGTSMAAPHVSGALALAAAMYPDETMDKRASRLLVGGDNLPTLKGSVATDSRLNLFKSLRPDLPDSPLVRNFSFEEDRRIKIGGNFFGDAPGKILFHDASAPDLGVDGSIVSWSDSEIIVDKPSYSGSYFYVVDEDGSRSGRRPVKYSLWGDRMEAGLKCDSTTACLLDGKIYTFGGFAGGNYSLRGWEVYDTETDKWEYTYGAWMPRNLAHLTSSAARGKIYLIGGYDTSGKGTDAVVNAVTAFDPLTRKFAAVSPLPVSACFSQAVTVGERIYVTGGLNENDVPLDAVYSFDPLNNAWKTESFKMTKPRFAHGAVTLNGKIYSFGGLETWQEEEVYTATGEIIDPAAGSVKPMAPMPIALARFGAATDGRFIYAVGGTNKDFWYTPADTVLRYDTKTNTWSSLPDRQLGRAKLAAPAVFVPGKGLYSIKGGFIDTENPGMFGPGFKPLGELAFLNLDVITDADADLIPDLDDNCKKTANRQQKDTDGDGKGDACDRDLDNDGTNDFMDKNSLSQFMKFWGSGECVADFNGDGEVNQADFTILRGRIGNTVFE